MTGSPTSNPRINIQLLPAALVDAFADRRDVIFGQTGVSGTAVDEALNTNMHLISEAALAALFGTGDLYYRILRWRDGVSVTDGGILPILDVVAVDPAGGASAATSDVVFAGQATEDASFTISIIDEKTFTLTVDVLIGDNATAVALLLDTAIGNLADAMFTSSPSSGTLTITADDVGIIGNAFGIKIDFSIAGLTVTVAAFTSGSGTPALTTVLDPIDSIRYTGVQWPESWDNTVITTELDARFNVSNDIFDGVAFQGSTDTFANNNILADGLNSQSLVLIGNNILAADPAFGPAILTPADWVASFFMGARDKRLSTGAQIADLIIATNAPSDATGGPGLASLPYFNTELTEAVVVPPTDLYNLTEQIELENSGFTTFGPNRAGNAVIMAPVVTTFTTDSGGNANDSFHFLNFVDTGSVSREIIFNTLKSTFSQSRLTEGNIVPGRSMANARSIKGELLDIYRVLANNALTQAGNDAEAFFSANTTVEIDLATRTATINGVLPIVTQLGVINYNLALAFTIGQTGTLITL